MKYFIILNVIIFLASCGQDSNVSENDEKGSHFIPITSYRTGPYAVSGTPAADAMIDYLKLINERDGGINGIPVSWEECETAYKPDRFIECYERLKNKGVAGAAAFNPFGTGLTYSVIDRVPNDEIPLITLGYGRTDASDGRVFPWVFPLVVNYWNLSTAKIKLIGSILGSMDNLKGKRIANIHHDSAYGKETKPILEKQAEIYGFTLDHFPVAHPGLDQKATWLNIRRYEPDFVILRGWGVMTQTSLKEASRAGISADKIIGVTWSCSEQDTIPAGQAAVGYRCASFTGAGKDYPIINDIKSYVYAKGNGSGPEEAVGTQLYKNGLVMIFFTIEAIKKASEKYGNKPLSGKEVRWGIENLKVTSEMLRNYGAEGLMPALSVSCSDHEGGSDVSFVQWNGESFISASDMITTDKSIVRPMIEASAAKYAAAQGLTLRDCSE